MVDDGTYTAVLDRFEGDLAVLVLEQGGTDVAEYPVEREIIPEAGRHQDAVFKLLVESGNVTELTYKPVETKERKEAAQDRFDRLSQRPPPEESDE